MIAIQFSGLVGLEGILKGKKHVTLVKSKQSSIFSIRRLIMDVKDVLYVLGLGYCNSIVAPDNKVFILTSSGNDSFLKYLNFSTGSRFDGRCLAGRRSFGLVLATSEFRGRLRAR